jgi:hypothetical protein
VKDASGLIGQYAHGNEPSHHMAYLYNFAGAAPKTQAIVHRVLETLYDDKPDGLEGNEDCGQMSAWYILSSMGFYSVTPGLPQYIIGTPLFEKVTINLENGKQFVIEAKNVSEENFYVQSATLNGKDYTRSWIRHSDIANGGHLVFTMGSKPNYEWGTSEEDRPHTPEFLPAVSLPYANTKTKEFITGTKVTLACDTKGAKIYYTLDGSEPDENSTLYSAPLTIKKTSELKFAAYKEGLQPSIVVKEKFTKLKYENYKDYSYLKFAPGLKYTYYEGKVMFVKELDELTPVKTGIVPTFSIDGRKTDTYFGFVYEGYLKVPRTGRYTIYNKTNDGSVLYIDRKEFINTDGGHPAYETFRVVALKKGVYKIKQKYFQMAGGLENSVSWEGAGIPKQIIPASALWHEE